MSVLEKLIAAASTSPKSTDIVLTKGEYHDLFLLSVAEVGADLIVPKGAKNKPRSYLFGSSDTGATYSGVRIHVQDSSELADAEKTA